MVPLIARKHLATAAKVVVGLGLVYFLLRGTNADELGRTLQRLNLVGFAVSASCLIAAVALNALRWNLVLRLLGTRLSLATTLVGTFEGMFFNLFLPTGVGGDAMRAYRAFDRGAVATVAIESALIDRAAGLWAVGFSLLVASPFAPILARIPSSGALIALSVAIVLGGFIVAVIGRVINPRRFNSWISPFADLVHSYGRVVFSLPFLYAILPASLIGNLFIASTLWALTRSLGLDLSYLDMLFVIQTSTLVALLPVSFGGWGLREGVTIFLLTCAGVSPGEATAVAILYGAVLILIGVIGAGAWMSSPYRGLARLSEMRLGRRPEPVTAPAEDETS